MKPARHTGPIIDKAKTGAELPIGNFFVSRNGHTFKSLLVDGTSSTGRQKKVDLKRSSLGTKMSIIEHEVPVEPPKTIVRKINISRVMPSRTELSVQTMKTVIRPESYTRMRLRADSLLTTTFNAAEDRIIKATSTYSVCERSDKSTTEFG